MYQGLQGLPVTNRYQGLECEASFMTTKHLELKIPPLAWVAIYAVLMKGCSLWLPSLGISIPHANGLAAMFVGVGLSFSLSGIRAVRGAGSTVDPRCPERASSLVSDGIYAVTRNPMYVGVLLFLTAWAVHLQNIGSLLLVGVFMATLTQLQIRPEERALEQLFGEAYLDYCARVPRWLFGSKA